MGLIHRGKMTEGWHNKDNKDDYGKMRKSKDRSSMLNQVRMRKMGFL